MTKYRLEVEYRVGRYDGGWYWVLHKYDENGKIIDSRGNTEPCLFRWTAILGGRRAARKTPYTKEFTI